MTRNNQLVECPGRCGQQVHPCAEACPHCGFRPELGNYEGLLGSLSTVCSILVGFGLAALVSLATDASNATDDILVIWAIRCWLFSTMLLLFVLVVAEFIRRRDLGVRRIDIPREEDEGIWRRCVPLLWGVTVALAGIAAGVVLLGFHFSLDQGIVACVAAGLGFLIVLRSLF